MYRLLIIEDEKDIAQTIAHNLSNYGFETKTIEDFSKIMETFKEFDPHMVLLDIKHPIMMAITATRRYAKYQNFQLFSFPQLPII